MQEHIFSDLTSKAGICHTVGTNWKAEGKTIASLLYLWKTQSVKVDATQLSGTLPVNSSSPFQVLTLPSQGFGLSQHISRQFAFKTMDMETERETLVPELY